MPSAKPLARRIARRVRRRVTDVQRGLRTPWPHLRVGPYSYGDYRVVYYDGDPPMGVEIGAYTSIATGVQLMIGGNHAPHWASTYPFRASFQLETPADEEYVNSQSRGPINIGSDVWIGREAMILSGVTVGHGAVIGARAVVSRDVRPYAVVVGSPAREVRRRFTDAQVQALLEIEWWTWPNEELLRIVPLLNGAPVDDLISYGRSRASSADA